MKQADAKGQVPRDSTYRRSWRSQVRRGRREDGGARAGKGEWRVGGWLMGTLLLWEDESVPGMDGEDGYSAS